ncbi:knob-associated histidine-rich protein, putative [Plasmodium knowlesi strain H]|uniref:Knob-associated histidine-rich protein, putative n=3 Tax=Plasmodium knowlesi TaxID=5850 RepID=A0A679L3Z0_PLAKH|nr:knob-associated histidine-rich protein, putative [Plasmodium knowlesi strain H]OTN67839.1 putative Knob-associated histidine-rich protein [Plasmodium knowlesi]CAA9990293.1 knob-associated histidine-rich protein, putative [Plasmodium knowlesi strain H]SBO19499.1 knob-associated histidine-rich protein, putative [Plasmodium knowlesi strain H]VVS79767.1 knob-associated histidine-rich protein, putative [Plasmodium knowlesi strain H]
MAILKGYSATEKINVPQFLCRTLFFSLLIWFLNCSNYEKCDRRSDQQCELPNGLKSTVSRSLSVVRRMGKYNAPLRTRIVKEVTRGGFKEYEEKYETKHYTLKENVDENNKDCDEKYEAANYGFREKCPYEVNPYTGATGPNILLLKKRFHQNLKGEEIDDDDDEEAPLTSKLPGSLEACERGCGGRRKRRSKGDDDYPTIVKEYEEVGAQGYKGNPRGRGHPGHQGGPDSPRRRPVKVVEPDSDMMTYKPPARGRGPARMGEHGAQGPSKQHMLKQQPQGNLKKDHWPTGHQGQKEQFNKPNPTVGQYSKPTVSQPPKPTVSQQPKPTVSQPPKPTVSQQPKPTVSQPPKPTVSQPPKPTVSEQAKKEQAKKEQAKKEQAKKEQAKKEQAKKEQAKKEQAKKEQAKKEQAKKEQAKKEQAKKEQAKKEQAKNDKSKKNKI